MVGGVNKVYCNFKLTENMYYIQLRITFGSFLFTYSFILLPHTSVK